MRATDPVVTFLLVLVIGIAAGILFDRVAGPSWLARQFSGSTRGIITSALVGVAGAFVGYHIAVLLALGGGLVTSIIAAATGAAVVLFAWRMPSKRRGNRSFALWNTRVRILHASVAHRDRVLAACGSGGARQHTPPCRSGTAALPQAVFRSGRVTTSAAARSRRVDRGRRRGTNSCQYQCPSWQWSRLICWTWRCSV